MAKLRTFHVPIADETRSEIRLAADEETGKVCAVSIDARPVSPCAIARRVLDAWAAERRAKRSTQKPARAKAG